MAEDQRSPEALRAATQRISQSARRTGRWISSHVTTRASLRTALDQTEPAPRRPIAGLDRSRRPAPSRMPSRSAVRPRTAIPEWLNRWGLGSWATIGIAIVVVGVVYLVVQVSAVFIALFISMLLTALLNPVVDWMSRRINRWVSVVATLLSFFAVFGGLMTLVVTSVVGQWPRLAAKFGDGIDMIIEFLQATPFHITLTHSQVQTWVNQMIDRGTTYVRQNWSTLAGDVLSNFSGVAEAFTVLALMVFTTIFFLQAGARMWRWFLNLLPDRHRLDTHRAAMAGWITFSGYARGTIIVAATDGLLAGVYLQVIGVPLAPALGVLVFIGAFIPLIGAPTAMVIAMIVALASGGVWQAVLVGLGIAGIGQLEGHILQPLIMGHQVSLHPLVVALGVAVGTLTAGILGAVIATPIIAVFWSVFTELHHFDPPLEGPLPTSGDSR